MAGSADLTGRPVRGSKADFVHPELAAAAAGTGILNTKSRNKKENKSERRKLENCAIMDFAPGKLALQRMEPGLKEL